MKSQTLLAVAIACALFTGCARQTRSISQPAYVGDRHHFAPPVRELDEFDVLGLDRDRAVTEEEIQRVTSESRPLRLASGSTVLLVQSGATYPDGPMILELEKHFRIVPFSGVAAEKSESKGVAQDTTLRNVAVITQPDQPITIVPWSAIARERYLTATTNAPANYSRTLRLAAARAGASTVMCYWGILESGDEKFATRTISWLPVANWVVPDQRQHMRIRLKIAMVDVASGNWTVFSAKPLETKAWSVRARREVADQKQIEAIKQNAYKSAVQGLIETYAAGL